MSSKTRAHLAVLGTNLFFAANFSFVKMIAPSRVQPFGLNVFRVGISLVLFWAVWLAGKKAAGIRKEDIGRFVLCALTGVAINQMLFLKGLTMTSTVHASLLMLTTPLLITVFALWVLKEKLTVAKLSGLLLGIGGAAMLIAGRETSRTATDYFTGDLLIIVNAVSYSLYFILVKPLMQRYSPLQVIRWVFTIGFLMILPFGFNEAAATDFGAFSGQQLAAFAAVIITGTFLAYYFNAYGIQHLGAAITGAYIYTQPVFAVVIAVLLMGEHFTIQKLVAALLIFGGVFLVGLKKKASD
jgi:drug/metabolite transporter (DMT)-like permease